MVSWERPLLLGVMLGLWALPGRTGTLDDFEKEATKDRDKSSGPAPKIENSGRERASRCEDDDEDSGESFECLFAEILWYGFVYGGAESWERASGTGEDPRERGEGTIPFVRTDLGLQRVRSDVTAWDGRVEAGYGPVALEVRSTRYSERSPHDRMSFSHGHLLYRMSFTRYVEIDLGGGPLYLNGNRRNAGSGLTMPVHVFIPRNNSSDSFGLEFRPVWGWVAGGPIKDYDASFLYVRPGWSAKAGYRWVRAGESSLDGPYLGVSFHY